MLQKSIPRSFGQQGIVFAFMRHFCNLSRRFPESLREPTMKLLTLVATTFSHSLAGVGIRSFPAAEPSALAWVVSPFHAGAEDARCSRNC